MSLKVSAYVFNRMSGNDLVVNLKLGFNGKFFK